MLPKQCHPEDRREGKGAGQSHHNPAIHGYTSLGPFSDDIQRCVLEEAKKALSKASCHVPGLAVTLRPYETET